MRRVLNNAKYHRNWLSYYFHKFGGEKDAPFEFQTRNGRRLAVSKRMQQTYKEMFFDEAYLKGFPDKTVLREAEVIIDIGGNVGYFTHFCLNENPGASVYVFEPIPGNFRHLSGLFEDGENGRVKAFQMAVGGSEGELELQFDDSEEITTSAGVLRSGDDLASIRVPCTTLEAILRDNGIDEVGFLKIDCEGAEYQILETAPVDLWNRVRHVAIETHPGDGPHENRDWVREFLKEQGYSVWIDGDMVYASRSSAT